MSSLGSKQLVTAFCQIWSKFSLSQFASPQSRRVTTNVASPSVISHTDQLRGPVSLSARLETNIPKQVHPISYFKYLCIKIRCMMYIPGSEQGHMPIKCSRNALYISNLIDLYLIWLHHVLKLKVSRIFDCMNYCNAWIINRILWLLDCLFDI